MPDIFNSARISVLSQFSKLHVSIINIKKVEFNHKFTTNPIKLFHKKEPYQDF